MKRKALALTFVMTLIFSFLFHSILVQPVESQSFEIVFIRAEGNVEGTDKIQRSGNVYTLTGNISGSIQVQRSHVVIDGAGYAVKGNGEGRGIDLSNGRGQDPSRPKISNVTVKNLKILNFHYSIDNANTGNNTFIGNHIENYESSPSDAGFWIVGSSNNNITQNTMINACIKINYAGSNSITKNNFINSWIHVWLSTQPIVDGNYWSDYSIKYPDAREIGDSGIWDTPYYDVRLGGWADNHPLVEPVSAPVDFAGPSIFVLSAENKTYVEGSIPLNFTVSEAVTQITFSLDGEENITISGNTTLTGLANGDHNVTIFVKDEAGNGASETIHFNVEVPEPTQPSPEPFPTASVAAASVATVAAVGVGLLVYFKKRSR